MAVYIDCINVIVRVRTLQERYPGGVRAYERDCPNGSFCKDEHLTRVGFMNPVDVERFIASITASGALTWLDGDVFADVAVVDMLAGPTRPCPWLEYEWVDDMPQCWMKGTDPGAVALPQGVKLSEPAPAPTEPLEPEPSPAEVREAAMRRLAAAGVDLKQIRGRLTREEQAQWDRGGVEEGIAEGSDPGFTLHQFGLICHLFVSEWPEAVLEALEALEYDHGPWLAYEAALHRKIGGAPSVVGSAPPPRRKPQGR